MPLGLYLCVGQHPLAVNLTPDNSVTTNKTEVIFIVKERNRACRQVEDSHLVITYERRRRFGPLQGEGSLLAGKESVCVRKCSHVVVGEE